MTESSEPSEWARERFGDAAETLMWAIPSALHRAHIRAQRAYDEFDREQYEAYGLVWIAANEEFVRLVEPLRQQGYDAKRIKPGQAHYELLRIGNVVLYPWRYAPTTKVRVEDVRMKPSGVRHDLLALSEPPPSQQLTFDQANMDAEQIEADAAQLEEELLQWAEAGRVVVVPYVSNPEAGVLSVEWGDASQADRDGHLNWTYREPLPRIDPGRGGGALPGPLLPVPGPDAAGGGARRFDDAPLDEPVLRPRPAGPVAPTADIELPSPETGTDEKP